MDSRSVSPEYLTAGQEYQDALIALGLTPHYLGWVWDIARKQWNLALVTSVIDAGGPLRLNRLLFRAYNAKATPQTISPFIVRVFSPDFMPVEFWALAYARNLTISHMGDRPDRPVKLEEPIQLANVQMEYLGLHFETNNGYDPKRPPLMVRDRHSSRITATAPKLKYFDRRREWERFRDNVERLAA
jgi:hypothetical protein